MTETRTPSRRSPRRSPPGRACTRARDVAASSPSNSAAGRSATCTVTTPRTSSSPPRPGTELKADGRITPHPVFPDKQGPAARRIESEDDVLDVIALMRVNYERALASQSVAS